MPFRVIRATMVVCAVIGLTGVAMAEPKAEPKEAAKLLFESNHLKRTDDGSKLKYRFQKSVNNEKILGKPFSDDLELAITKAEEEKRNFKLQIFTGARARSPFSDHDRVGNPLLLWYLDRAVKNYKSLARGSLTYMKNRFMDALQKAELEDAKVSIDGKDVEAHRMTLQPYANDPNKSRMMGYQNSRFVIVFGDNIPGYLFELSAVYENTDEKAPRLEERIRFAGAEGGK